MRVGEGIRERGRRLDPAELVPDARPEPVQKSSLLPVKEVDLLLLRRLARRLKAGLDLGRGSQ